MTEHTPTPWFKGRKFEVGPRPSTDDQSDGMVCPVADVYGDNREADAASIIKAVNNHDALIAALEEIEDLGANGETAARLGNIAHAALIAIRHPVGAPIKPGEKP